MRASRNRIWEVAGDVASVVLVLVLLEEEQLGGLKSEPKIRGKKDLVEVRESSQKRKMVKTRERERRRLGEVVFLEGLEKLVAA